jgi:MFS family permease
MATTMNEVAPPRISRRRAVAITVAGLTVAGALIGALWAWLAPPIHGVVALTKSGERVKAYLGNEADQFFVAAFLIVGMVGAVAVVAAVLLWQWRAHRGPAMVAALAIGVAAAAGAASGVGAVLVRLRYGAIDIAAAPVSPEHRVHYVVEAPSVFFGHSPLEVVATILFPAAIAALVYALMAVSTARDDLGAWPPVEEPVIGPPVTAESAQPPAQ